jgi:hypothetical protein
MDKTDETVEIAGVGEVAVTTIERPAWIKIRGKGRVAHYFTKRGKPLCGTERVAFTGFGFMLDGGDESEPKCSNCLRALDRAAKAIELRAAR